MPPPPPRFLPPPPPPPRFRPPPPKYHAPKYECRECKCTILSKTDYQLISDVFDPDGACQDIKKALSSDPKYQYDDRECSEMFAHCCPKFEICPLMPDYMYSVYSSIGCVVFVVLLVICVFIWKKVCNKKKGGSPRGGFTGTATGTTATGTTGTGTKGHFI